MNKEKLLKIEHIILEIKEVCGSCENHSCSLYPGRHSWTSNVDCRLYDFVSRRPSDMSWSSSRDVSMTTTGDMNSSRSIEYK